MRVRDTGCDDSAISEDFPSLGSDQRPFLRGWGDFDNSFVLGDRSAVGDDGVCETGGEGFRTNVALVLQVHDASNAAADRGVEGRNIRSTVNGDITAVAQ